MSLRSLLIIAMLTVVGCPAAFANTVSWTAWNAQPCTNPGTDTGTMGGVTVTYSGEITFCNESGIGNFNYFLPLSTYTSVTAPNAPTDGGMIAISGPDAGNTFTFSSPVQNLIFSVVSLGQAGVPVSYNFDAPFTILSCGPGIPFGGGCVTQSGNSLIGAEGDGTIEFAGTFSSLSFTVTNGEYWNGFTIGSLGPPTSAVPEPATILLLGSGLCGLWLKRRQKR